MLQEFRIPFQSGCDSFYESREDLISHLALYHKQLDLKMEERGKSINVRETKKHCHSILYCELLSSRILFLFHFQEFYEIYSASDISPACYKKSEMEDLTRVASNSARSKAKKGTAERRVENSTGEERNASESVETVSSSSGSTAAAAAAAPKNTNGTEKRCAYSRN